MSLLSAISWWAYAALLVLLLIVFVVLIAYRDVVRKVIKDTNTGLDNEAYDWAKVTGTFSIATFNAMYIWRLLDDNIFEPVPYATGMGIIISAVCAGVAVKRFATPTVVAGTTSKKSESTVTVDAIPVPQAKEE